MKKITLIATAVLLSLNILAQAPVNNDCSGAIMLTSSGVCTPTLGTVFNANQSQLANCGGTAGNDVWYTFISGSTPLTITVAPIGGATAINPVFELFTTSCGGTTLGCANGGGGAGAGAPISFIYNGLSSSTQYWVRVYSWSGISPANPTFNICITSPLNCLTSHTNNLCFGDTTAYAFASGSGGNPPYTYSWNTIPVQTNDTAMNLSTGSYTVTVTDFIGNTAYGYVNVSNPALLGISTNVTNTSCGVTNGQITAYVSGGTLPYHYLWSNGDTTNTSSNLPGGTYSLIITDFNGCSATTALLTVNTDPLTAIPLCLVTVDTLSTHNIVVWEKTGIGAEVDSFRIYRETTTNFYSNIASVSNDSLSEYHDYAANPNVTSYKYKLALLDTCGGISSLNDFHNTIHLQYLGNGNLQWTLYDIENAGNPVNFYIINRDDNNTGTFLPISSTIPGGNSTYTDINYASYPNASYRVDADWSISCNPTRSASTTHSNIIHLGTTVSITQIDNANSITISPNPFTSQTTITINDASTGSAANTTIKIMDVLGNEILKQVQNDKSVTLDLTNIAKGIYFVEITKDEKIWRKKIIKD